MGRYNVALLGGLRNMLSRRQPSPAGNHSDITEEALKLSFSSAEPLSEEPAQPVASGVVEPKPETPAPVQNPQLTQDYFSALLCSLNEHLDHQSEHLDRLMASVQCLPDQLASPSEHSRDTTRLLKVLSEQMADAAGRDESIGGLLERLQDTVQQQSEQFRQEFDDNRQQSSGAVELLAEVRPMLDQLLQATRRSNELISDLRQTSEEEGEQLTSALVRSRRWMIATVILCAFAAGTAAFTAIIFMAW